MMHAREQDAASRAAPPPQRRVGRLPRLTRSASISLMLGVLAACALPGPGPARHYYVLQAAPPAPLGREAPQRAARPAVLLVAPTTAASFYATQDIVFSRSAGTRAYYQYSRWTEPPQRRIEAELMSRLEASGMFGTVASATSGVTGTLLLRTRVDDMVHDAATSPGTCRIVLTAELTDTAHHTLLARKTFTASAPAASYDAPGAVQGFDAALGALLGDVTHWLDDAGLGTR